MNPYGKFFSSLAQVPTNQSPQAGAYGSNTALSNRNPLVRFSHMNFPGNMSQTSALQAGALQQNPQSANPVGTMPGILDFLDFLAQRFPEVQNHPDFQMMAQDSSVQQPQIPDSAQPFLEHLRTQLRANVPESHPRFSELAPILGQPSQQSSQPAQSYPNSSLALALQEMGYL